LPFVIDPTKAATNASPHPLVSTIFSFSIAGTEMSSTVTSAPFPADVATIVGSGP